jgi:hypothetical protein
MGERSSVCAERSLLLPPADPRYRVDSPRNRHGIERAGPMDRLFVSAKDRYGLAPARALRPR